MEEVRSDREAGSHDEYNEERHQAEPDMLLLHAAVFVAVVLRRHLGQLQHAPIIAHNESCGAIAITYRVFVNQENSALPNLALTLTLTLALTLTLT